MRGAGATQDAKGKSDGRRLGGRHALEHDPTPGRTLRCRQGTTFGSVAEPNDITVVTDEIANEIGWIFIGYEHRR